MKQTRWPGCGGSSSHRFWHRGTGNSTSSSHSMACAVRSHAWGHRTWRFSWSAGRKYAPRFTSEHRWHFKEGM